MVQPWGCSISLTDSKTVCSFCFWPISDWVTSATFSFLPDNFSVNNMRGNISSNSGKHIMYHGTVLWCTEQVNCRQKLQERLRSAKQNVFVCSRTVSVGLQVLFIGKQGHGDLEDVCGGFRQQRFSDASNTKKKDLWSLSQGRGLKYKEKTNQQHRRSSHIFFIAKTFGYCALDIKAFESLEI